MRAAISFVATAALVIGLANGVAAAAPAPAPGSTAAKPAPADPPAVVASQDKKCTLSPSLDYPAGELRSCLAVGVALSAVPTVGDSATLTVTVQAARAENTTEVTVDLPSTFAFTDGTATHQAYSGGGKVARTSPVTMSLAAGETRTFTRTVRAVSAGFGEIAASGANRLTARRTDSGKSSVFITTASTAARSHLGADAPVSSTHASTAPATYTGAGPQRVASSPLRAAPRTGSAKPRSAGAPGTSCASGGFFYVDQLGVTRPLHNITVQVRNPSNTVLASGYTGGTGLYNVCYATGGATTSIYLQFQLQNNVWSVQDFSNNVYSYSTGIVSVPDGTTRDFGTLQPGVAAQMRAAHAFQEADDEWQWMYQFVSYQGGCWSPYDTTCFSLAIHWAAGNTSMGTNWNASRGAWLLDGSPDTLDEPVHEYGHALMYELYGQNFPTTDCTTHDLFVVSGPVCGWTEGWADWVATSVYNNTVWTYNGGGSRDFNVTWNEGLGYATGDRVEGRVVQAMRSLSDGTKAPWDQDAGEGGGIKDNSIWFNVMHTDRPNTFADVWNDRAAIGYDVSQPALSALYQGTIDYGFRNPLTNYVGQHLPEAVPDHNYSHTTTTGYWSVVAVKPDAGSDVDLTLYNDFAQSSSLGSSAYGGTTTDFIGINSNTGHRALQTYYPRAHQFSGSGGYTVEEAQGSVTLTSGSSTNFMSATQPVRVWDSYQTTGTPIYYRAVGSSGQDVQLASLSADGNITARSSATSGVDPGVDTPATLVVTPTATGYAGLVLLNNNLTAGSVTVYADSTPSADGTVSINAGAATTKSRNVTLALSATDAQTGISQMQISTDGIFDTEPVVPYATSGTASLPGASGTKTMYVRYLNNAGIWSTPVTDTIGLTLPPAVTAVSPKSGPLAGGNTVTFTGTDFTGATAVKFDTTAATSFTVVSGTTITAKAPAHAAGAVHVFVTTPNGTSALAAEVYTYQAAPTVTAVSPISGPTAGGNTVTLTGTNFTGASVVKFDTTAATSVMVVSATKITAKAPAHAAGRFHVTVTTASGTSPIRAGVAIYTYQAAPTVTAVSPANGSTAGGNTVTLTGTNFIGASAVKFGTTLATGVTDVSATKITATAPAHAAGGLHVYVTTPSGTSPITNGVAVYTYKAAP